MKQTDCINSDTKHINQESYPFTKRERKHNGCPTLELSLAERGVAMT